MLIELIKNITNDSSLPSLTQKKLEEYHQNTDDNIVGVGYGYKTKNGILTDQLSIIFTVYLFIVDVIKDPSYFS